MAFTVCQEREKEKKIKGAERIFQGWKVVHTINSLTLTARNPIFSGSRVFFFFFFGLCAEMTIYVPNTVMCNLGDLVSSLAFLQFR